MLYEMLASNPLEKNAADRFSPFPAYHEREKWDSIAANIKAYYEEKGKSLQNKKWDSLPASLYLDFVRNGNRSRYEQLYFQRRTDLFTLTIAECLEGKGRYLDDILNGVWLICEETTWVIPAHNGHPPNHQWDTGLGNIDAPVYIDLFSAETGSLITWIYYFLADELTKVSPLVKRRMEKEMDRRIIKPYLAHDDFGWMGLNHDKPVNNWNPWINSNILTAFMIFAENREEKIAGIEKTVKSMDRFIHFYQKDGGCDEGPGYFGVAGASLLDFLEELDFALDIPIGAYQDEMIKNMARYIYKVYIGQSWYVNFADAPARVSAPAGLLYRTGEKISDENLTGFAKHLMDHNFLNSNYQAAHSTMFRTLANIFQKLSDTPPFIAPKASWFEGIQVLTARDTEGITKGMFIAAKGGHNEESHNHNDIGNFILYYDEEPVIIDAGVETYSQKTFSSERYDIWTMQSCYHNTPTINGFQQLNGLERNASSVSFNHEDNTTALSMDIHKAYPSEALIEKYSRSFLFKHGECFLVKDTYLLSKALAPLTIHLLCFNEPAIQKRQEGIVLLNASVQMVFDHRLFDAGVEEIILEDRRLKENWGKDRLYRIQLTQKELACTGEVLLRFEKI